MTYYDQATSDALKGKFADLAKPTGADFSGLISYFDNGLQGMDEALSQTITIADGTVTPEKTTFASESGYKNEIDSSKIIQGRYYSGTSVGSYTLGDATYGTIEIDLIPGESYLLFGASGSLSWIYNSASLTKLSSFTGQSSYLNTASGLSNDYVIKFKAPLGATTIYISARIGLATMLPTMLFRTGDSLFLKDYVPYNTYLNRKLTIKDLQEPLAEKALSLIPKNRIHVKKDGTGDFTSLVTAIRSISDSSIDNVYDIYVYDDHDIMDELGGQTFAESLTSSSDREGLVIPEYVNIIAIGKKELSLKLNHSWNVNYNAIKALSVLEVSKGNNVFENLNFIARNARYAVHDESSGKWPNSKVIYNNCEFIHEGNDDFSGDTTGQWLSSCGYGSGMSSGVNREFYNCKFKSKSYYPFSCHDNANFSYGASLNIFNCEFENEGGNSTYAEDIKLSTYSTGNAIDTASINNTLIKSVLVRNEVAGQPANRWEVKGSGNYQTKLAESGKAVPFTITF